MKAEEWLRKVEVYYPSRESWIIKVGDFEILQEKMKEEGLEFDFGGEEGRFQLKRKQE